MKLLIIAISLMWVGLGAVFAQGISPGGTAVNNLNAAAPLGGSELFPVYQGGNPLVSVPSSAIKTYVNGDMPTPYLGQVATRTSPPNTNGTSSNPQGMSRSTHFARSNITSLQVVFAGFYYSTGDTETARGAATSVTASVEYPVGTITRITFSASNTGSIPSGSYLVSDPISVAIPYGAMFFIREWESNVNGIVYNNSFGSPAGVLAPTDGYQFGTTTPDLTGGGAVAGPGFQGMHFPLAIIAQTVRPSVCLFGDSRAQGYGDTADTYGDIGEFSRAIGPSLAYINWGVGGATAQGTVATPGSKVAFSAYCSHILLNYGVNDLIFVGRTAAQVVANMNSIIGLFPGKEIWITTIPPVSSSTDGWVTTTNQTTNANNSVRVTYNTDVRVGSFIVGARGYIEMAGAVESAFNSGLWAVSNGTALTVDGTHENLQGSLKEQASAGISVGSFAR